MTNDLVAVSMGGGVAINFALDRLIADLIEASVVGLRRIDRPELGHLLHLEDPEHCVRAIRSFWRASSMEPALARTNS